MILIDSELSTLGFIIVFSEQLLSVYGKVVFKQVLPRFQEVV